MTTGREVLTVTVTAGAVCEGWETREAGRHCLGLPDGAAGGGLPRRVPPVRSHDCWIHRRRVCLASKVNVNSSQVTGSTAPSAEEGPVN